MSTHILLFNGNSNFPYTDQVMSFICGGKPWRGLFDFVVCSARKPDFFFSNKQFRQWNFATRSPSPYPVAKFEADAVYNYGSVTALKRAGVIGNEGAVYDIIKLYQALYIVIIMISCIIL